MGVANRDLATPIFLYSTHELLPNFQTPQQVEILFGIDPLHVIQQTATPTDHPQQTTPTGVVLGMQKHVLSHLGDPTGEQRNLDLWRARVRAPTTKFTLQLLFPLFR